jgi:putative ABC transport system permease protein
MNVDDHFIDLMDIEYVTRFDEVQLKGNLIANESAAENLQVSEDSLAKEISLGMSKGFIAGVTHDFNYTSLKNKVEPMVMSVLDDTTRSMITYGGAMYVKLGKGADVKEALASVKEEVSKFQPDAPFEYYFLDEAFNNLYKSEERMATLLSGFTFLAILIAGMGLLGMITFTLERRVREFGIRKVLGASEARITWMVMGEYLLIFVLSALFAVPLAWWAMSEWLTSFSYRIDVGMIHPLLAVTITLFVGISTIALRTWHASRANPAESLRVEA